MAEPPPLIANPTELKWQYDEGQQVFKLINRCGTKMAFKIKTSNPSVYSAAPVTAIVDNDHAMMVAIVRTKASWEKEDKLVVLSVPADPETTCAQEAFEKCTNKPASIIIKLSKKDK